MRSLLACLTCLLAVAVPGAALACGGIFEPIESQSGAAFESQTVLIHRRAATIDLHVRMTVTAGQSEVSWVLPTPTGATLSLGDDALFDTLDGLTRPTITVEYVGGSGGCSAPGDGAATPGDGVDVREVGRIGEYDFAIVGSGDAGAVVSWLTDNGFGVPDGAEAAMQPYADAGLDFIGVRLARPAADTSTRPTPLVVTVEDDTGDLPTYPLGMSALSMGASLPVLVYVLGPGRAAVTDAEQTTVVEIADRIRQDRWMDYEDAVDATQEGLDGPLWVTDAVVLDPGAVDTGIEMLGPAAERAVLTRLSARLPPEHVADARLVWHPEPQAAVDPVQYRAVGNPDEGCTALAGPVSAPWLLAGFLGLLRLRRRGRGRAG